MPRSQNLPMQTGRKNNENPGSLFTVFGKMTRRQEEGEGGGEDVQTGGDKLRRPEHQI